jgi:hypothetical protein
MPVSSHEVPFPLRGCQCDQRSPVVCSHWSREELEIWAISFSQTEYEMAWNIIISEYLQKNIGLSPRIMLESQTAKLFPQELTHPWFLLMCIHMFPSTHWLKPIHYHWTRSGRSAHGLKRMFDMTRSNMVFSLLGLVVQLSMVSCEFSSTAEQIQSFTTQHNTLIFCSSNPSLSRKTWLDQWIDSCHVFFSDVGVLHFWKKTDVSP